MKSIIVIGAGRSCSSLIRYLLENSRKENWSVVIADRDQEVAQQKVDGHENGTAVSFDASNREERIELIKNADLVVSMLPASMHIDVAKDCLEFGIHVITPSYVTKEMSALDQEVKSKGLIFLNEMGVDPGIDHMSAMKIIHEV